MSKLLIICLLKYIPYICYAFKEIVEIMSLDFLKFIFSSEFRKGSSDLISVLKQSEDWKNDIKKLSGTFYHSDKDKSDVLIDRSLNILKSKGWKNREVSDVKFIFRELRDNAFLYGLPNKEYSSVNIDVTITSPYIRIAISDNGKFDLKQELNSQEFSIKGSTQNKGLSLIYQITPELSQSQLPRNTVVVIKRRGCNPLETEKRGDIVILKVGTTNYITDDNYSVFGEALHEFHNNQKIVVDFGSESTGFEMPTRVIRTARKEIGTAIQSGSNVCICGLNNAPVSIKDYFSKEFHVEDCLDDAIEYLNKQAN